MIEMLGILKMLLVNGNLLFLQCYTYVILKDWSQYVSFITDGTSLSADLLERSFNRHFHLTNS